MDEDLEAILAIMCVVGGVILFIAALGALTVDYSDTQAIVKVQEVGTRYAFLMFGEQHYIRVQNMYSEQYAASSEAWETCIDSRDYALFNDAKNKKLPLSIHVKGNGISSMFTCTTGDRVISAEVIK